MPDPDPDEEIVPQPASDSGAGPPTPKERSRRVPLTPEQRRFLGRGRSAYDQPAPAPPSPKSPEPETVKDAPSPPPDRPQKREKRVRPVKKWRPARVLETQNLVLIIGALILLALTFYIGKKFEYWKYAITTRNNADLAGTEASKYPGVSAEELVDQALVAERLGHWQEAGSRYIAAKYKNMSFTGLIFRAGKLYYDHGDFDDADRLFDHAVAFGENVAQSNYFRGMIASGRQDYPAAENFFEAASNAEPFNADYLYSWAETLRKDRRPGDAVSRYQQAALRATEHEAVVCRFKARMATIEAGDTKQLENDLAKQRGHGPARHRLVNDRGRLANPCRRFR